VLKTLGFVKAVGRLMLPEAAKLRAELQKGWYVTLPEGHTYGWKLLKVDLTGKATQLGQGTRWGFAIPSPDGRHVAVTGPALTSNVWMLENF
jgi:hypothetical protein